MKTSKILWACLLAVAAISLAFYLKAPNAVQVNASVEIRKTSDGHLAAIVKDDPTLPQTIFILQSDVEPSFSAPKIIANSRVENFGNCIVFASKSNNQKIIFKLSNSDCQNSSVGNTEVYSGFGLIQQQSTSVYELMITSPGPTFPPTTEIAVCSCNANGTDARKCKSGGEGASQCSQSQTISGGLMGASINTTTTCNVTCTSGYYACCYID